MTKDAQFWRDHIQRNPTVLDSGTRIWEIVCGLIMVLTFTGSISAANADREDIRLILWAALGCNTAWGIVDALMFLMSTMVDRNEGLSALNRARGKDPKAARESIKEYLPPVVGVVITENQLEEIREGIVALPDPPARVFVVWADIKNSISVFLLVFLSTFPVVIPFLFKISLHSAMRISNGIVLALLFACGMIMGGQTGYRRILVGAMLALIGAVLVAITVALGG